MGRSAGTGSPVWFRCANARRGIGIEHVVTLTGRSRVYDKKHGSMGGSRSSELSREYECSCGKVGWSNHIDLERMEARMERVTQERWRHRQSGQVVEVLWRERSPDGETGFRDADDGTRGSMSHDDFKRQFEPDEGGSDG